MDELLQLPACTNDRTSSLRYIYDNICVLFHICGQASQEVSADQYGSLLIPVIMEKLPNGIRLDIARKATGEVWKIDELLEAIKCLKSGGDAAFAYILVTYVSIASCFNVSKIWKKFCNEGRNINPSPRGRDRSSKFSKGDLELLEVLKKTPNTIQLNELYSILEEFGDCGGASLSAIS